jgi:hypothetical protein
MVGSIQHRQHHRQHLPSNSFPSCSDGHWLKVDELAKRLL